MNKPDIIISVIILIPALIGLKNGFLKSIFSLAGIIAGLFLATRYNDKITSALSFLKTDEKLLSILSFITIIILTYFIFSYAAGKLSRINPVATAADKLLGISFGILKGLIVASLLLILLENTLNIFTKIETESSVLYRKVITVAPDIYDYMKMYFPDAKEFYDELNHIFTGKS
ncbi:MAG: CvpA family protein [Ignavibacteria bacterium]|nr:CvpA family protein [Ignavibacteria bacterium]